MGQLGMISEAMMTIGMQVASLFLIACCIFGVSSLLASAAYLASRKYVRGSNFHMPKQWLVFHALSAFSASIIVIVWLSLPQSTKMPFVFKHCHNSNCTTHIPSLIESSLLNFLFTFFIISMIVTCFILIKAHQKTLEERTNSLLRLSKVQDNLNNQWSQITIVESSVPVLLNFGMLNPKLILSSKITESVAQNDVKLLLAYEYCKAKQYENLKIKLVKIVCIFWPGTIRRLLVTDLRNMLHARAQRDIHQLLGSHNMTIPVTLLDHMPQDIGVFIEAIRAPRRPLNDCDDTNNADVSSNTTLYLLPVICLISIVVLTSNFTHFLFELIG